MAETKSSSGDGSKLPPKLAPRRPSAPPRPSVLPPDDDEDDLERAFDQAAPELAASRTPPPPTATPTPTATRERRSLSPVKAETRKPIEIGDGMQIGRFELIRELARGGMGQVFLARDTKLGRRVAIKFLLHADPTFAQRFLIEARATARCTHENIVAIYEVGEHDGMPFMVLEYLEGKTLSQVLDGKPSLVQFTEIMISVLRALERAQEHGIVHRDLKPSNIFVTDRGPVKVLDFGVARIFDAGGDAAEQSFAATSKVPRAEAKESTYVTFSGIGTVVGTLPYMSPEQWGADVVDHQSDLWAVGIMFWRALTGVHPAGTMNPDKLRARLKDLDTPLPSIGAREPSLPHELVAVVDKLLAKKKPERYASASEALAALQTFLAPKIGTLGEHVSPYRGLAAFGESDAKYFFGRSNEIRTALAQLDTWPLLAVIGPSGVGKSSFVHAGLVPGVRDSGGTWHVRVLRPGRAPLASLAATLDDSIATGEAPAELLQQLREAPGLYGELLRRAARTHQHKVLIVVDQLEELFTLSDDAEARQLFLAGLLAAADDPSAPVRVVLSMRADFLDRLAGHKQFLAELSRGLFFLSAPDRDNLRETLVRPAELAGYAFEDPWIVDDMMEAATSRGALALLQFAATRLWDARDRARHQLTIAAYNQMGGIGGAFARHADEVAAAVPTQSQPLLRAILTRLVTPEGTRAVVDHDELLGLSSDRQEVARILDQLVRARLIVVHTDAASGPTVEIVHEVLITEWPTLRRWLEDSQALRGFMAELRTAVKQWVQRGRPSDLVWRGATAQEALALAQRHVLELSEAERAFLGEVRTEATRRRRRKVLALGAVFAVLAVVIAGGAFFTIRLDHTTAQAVQAEQEAIGAKAQVQAQLATVQAAEKAAREAKAQLQGQLDAVRAADARRDAAVAEAAQKSAEANQANAAVAQSKEDLQRALVLAQQEAVAARRATSEAKGANAKLQTLLAAEKQRVHQLELEKAKIATGGLR